MTQTDFGTKESRQNSSKNQVIEKLNDDKPTAAFSHGAKSFTIEDFNRIPPPPPIQAFCENTRIFLRLGLRVSIKNHLLLAIRKTSLAINVPPIKTYKINFARIFRRRVVKNIENFKTELWPFKKSSFKTLWIKLIYAFCTFFTSYNQSYNERSTPKRSSNCESFIKKYWKH